MKSLRFDVFERVDTGKLGEMVAGNDPTICFDGGDTYQGWLHEFFSLTERGLTYAAWDSGGYQESLNEDERPADVEELKAYILQGKTPLPRWSNLSGLEFLNKVMNGVTEEEIKRRIAQVRDALNKCRNIERIEAAARVFGI